MLNPPRAVDHLPTLEHNGVEILPVIHYGFSTPKKGPQPAPRTLYGAKDEKGERHWRSTLDDIQKLIENNFQQVEKEPQS